MPRPQRVRRIRGNPSSDYFKPAGVPLRQLEESCLGMDEFEALRLVDEQGHSQLEASTQMNVSQPTLSRILESARKKLADAVVNGKAIQIQRKE